jgi:hypothetical protein
MRLLLARFALSERTHTYSRIHPRLGKRFLLRNIESSVGDLDNSSMIAGLNPPDVGHRGELLELQPAAAHCYWLHLRHGR